MFNEHSTEIVGATPSGQRFRPEEVVGSMLASTISSLPVTVRLNKRRIGLLGCIDVWLFGVAGE
jgi:hypothetical protein